jgi:hypothetical protein
MGLKPTDTFEVIHPHDTDKPADEQRVFTYTHRCISDWIDFATQTQVVEDSKGFIDYAGGLIELASRGLVGWSDKRKFDRKIGEVLKTLEMLDLCYELPNAAMMDELDKKKLRLQLQSQQASSAPDVNQDAATSQPQTSPTTSSASPAPAKDAQLATTPANGG